MSTDLKTRSKAYTLTRFSMAASTGGVAVQVSTGYNKPYMSLTVQDIEGAFASDDWTFLSPLDLLDETMERLRLDLAQFALSKGKGMEYVDDHIGGNTSAQVLTNLVEFIDFLDATEGAAPFAGDNRKEWLEHRAAAAKVVAIR